MGSPEDSDNQDADRPVAPQHDVHAAERHPAIQGARAVAPMAVGIVPFATVYGVTITQTPVDTWVGLAASGIIAAGASQIALLDFIRDGAAWFVAVGAALIINARMLLYSAAVAPAFREFPPAWRYGLACGMTDQAVAVSLAYFDRETDPRKRRVFMGGAAVTLLTVWFVGNVAGVIFGSRIPASWQLGFGVPLTFLAIVVPTLTTRPLVVTAVVAAAVTVLAAPVPYGANLLIGSLAGIAAGMLMQRSARSAVSA